MEIVTMGTVTMGIAPIGSKGVHIILFSFPIVLLLNSKISPQLFSKIVPIILTEFSQTFIQKRYGYTHYFLLYCTMREAST